MAIDQIDCVVIGGGQAGLSAAYFLERMGLGGRYTVLDAAPGPGGAWQFRWPTLTLAGANHVHDLPGLGLTDALGLECDQWPASSAVPTYFGRYEQEFGLAIRRPVRVSTVRPHDDGSGQPAFAISAHSPDTGEVQIVARTVINATGTWDHPFVSGAGSFRGRVRHTHDYTDPHDYDGRRVLVIGAGISAIQLLIEIARTANDVTTFWCSRREPEFSDEPFTAEAGRAAVARVEQRVRAGLAPTSVVSVTGLARTPAIAAAEADGILAWRPMFDRIESDGVSWTDGDHLALDDLLWCTGFRSALDHLAPLRLRGPGGGIRMTGRLATVVAAHPSVQLLGYGPSASTIGANRAGRDAARVVRDLL